MDARLPRLACAVAILLSLGAGYRTQNFIVSASSPQLAKEVGDAAESQRRELALEWLGRELPPWRDPCPIRVTAAPNLGAGGVTSFAFERGQPFSWSMSVQGSRERILDSVLPHEITHTIFATHFGRPLPRWADEGACTTVEHISERSKHEKFLNQFLRTDRGIAFNKMFAMDQYPDDILPLYSQGYSLANYLIQQGGKQKFVGYVGDGMRSNNWTAATSHHYGYASLSDLQTKWLDWVRVGMPEIGSPRGIAPETVLASVPAVPPAVQPVASVAAPPATLPTSNAPAMVPVGTAYVAQVDAPSVAPAHTAAPADGWYARQRDQHRQSGTTRLASLSTSPKSPVHGASQAALPNREPLPRGTFTRPEASREHFESVSRPQPPERPQQRVLEWSRDPASAAGPAPIHVTPTPPMFR